MLDAMRRWIITSDKSAASTTTNTSFETCVTKNLFITFSISTKLTLGRVIVYSLPIRAGMLIMLYAFVFVELSI